MKYQLLTFLLPGICFGLAAARPRNASTHTQPIKSSDNPEFNPEFFQGDMDIKYTRNALRNSSLLWPNKTVYYRFGDAGFTKEHMQAVLDTFKRIEKVSCVHFQPAQEGQADYINITGNPTGCHAHVGHIFGEQFLNLDLSHKPGAGCFLPGRIAHEVLHALGFVHQHSTTDRDDYVSIVYENMPLNEIVLQDMAHFDLNTLDGLGVSYDYGSIMHYPADALSLNGEKTIIPKQDPNLPIGQRIELSPKDIYKLNLLYNCTISDELLESYQQYDRDIWDFYKKIDIENNLETFAKQKQSESMG